MKKYTVTWGWEPPQQEQIGTNLRVFYNSEQKTREVQNPEINEITTEKYWICDNTKIDYIKNLCDRYNCNCK